MHQLVELESWDGPADPDVDKDPEECLDQEDTYVINALNKRRQMR